MSSKPPAPRRTGLAALRGWFGLVVIVAVLVVLRLLLSLFTQFGDTLYVSDAAAIAELQAVGRRARALHGAHRRGEPLHVDPPCSLVPYGTGYGRHDLCNLSAISALSDSRLSPADAEPPCLVVSVGINKDFSFDQDIHRMHGCEGVAFDLHHAPVNPQRHKTAISAAWASRSEPSRIRFNLGFDQLCDFPSSPGTSPSGGPESGLRRLRVSDVS
jgi:hypothetical protein